MTPDDLGPPQTLLEAFSSFNPAVPQGTEVSNIVREMSEKNSPLTLATDDANRYRLEPVWLSNA
jgi:hypothetical protein